MEPTGLQQKRARHDFSMAYLSVAVLIAANLLMPQALQLLGATFIPGLITDPSFLLIYQYAGIFFINFPLSLLVLNHSAQPAAPSRRKMRAGQVVVYFTITYFAAFIGNLIGTLVSLPINYTVMQDAVTALTQSSVGARLLIICVTGPLMEEIFFRKFLIDRLGRYGPQAAILASSVMFALYHGNITQFFYTFSIGLVLGHLYTRSGRLLYIWVIHCVINLLSTVVAPALIPGLFDTTFAMDSLIPVSAYAIAIFAVIIAGLVNLIIHRRKIPLFPHQKGWATPVFLNWGIIAASAASVFYIYVTVFSAT